MARRSGRALPKVGAAAAEFGALASEIRRFGIDVKLLSMDPLTIRCEVAEGEADERDGRSAMSVLVGLFRNSK